MGEPKKIIIFGAGKRGKLFLEGFGAERVAFFCDNFSHGKKIMDKEVLDFTKLEYVHRQYDVVLSTENDDIRCQLQEAGIPFVMAEDYLRQAGDCCIDSQVEFYLVDSFELSHYMTIYQALRREGIRAVMVSEPLMINTAGVWYDQERTQVLLDKFGVEWYPVSHVDAPVAFTTQFVRNLSHYKKRKVKLCYGASLLKKKAFELEPDVSIPFDHIFTNGAYYKREIESFLSADRVTDIAFPRYMDFFRCKPERKDVKKKYGIQVEKPILVYYPTWDEYSSIQDFAPEIGKLRKEFYLIAKPHHCTWRLDEKEADLRVLYENFDRVMDGLTNLEELSVLTDIAICDAMSGVMCEIPFLNPQVKMMVISNNAKFENFNIDPRSFVKCIERPENLIKEAISLKQKDPFIGLRSGIVGNIFSRDCEEGVKRCVEVVKRLIEDVKSE